MAPILTLLLAVPLALLHQLNDPDTWWHLRSGADLWHQFVLVGPDPWSPLTTNTWVRHQWLAEMGMERLVQSGGLAALGWSVAVMGAVMVATSYVVLRRDASVLVASIVTVPAVVGTTVSLTARPQTLSFPLTIVVAAAWWRTARDGRTRWWLVPLTFVWACLHGFWIIAPIMGFVISAGLILERRPWSTVLRQVGVAAACVLSAAVTPVGPRLLLSALDVSAITGFIQEWLPAPEGMPAFLSVAGMLLAAAALWSWGSGPTWPEVLLMGLAAYLTVSHGRTIALAAMIAAPLLASSLTRRSPRRPEPLGRREVVAVVAALAVGIAAAAVLAPVRANRPIGFPTALNRQLDAVPKGTVVCNDYWVGGWLLWAHPHLVPVIDGRTELYTPNDLEDYLTMSGGEPGWEDIIDEKGCSVALVESDGPLAEKLTAAGWTSASDGRWELLTAP